MTRFEITGVGRSTGRKRVRIYEAKDQEDAIMMAASDGTVVETDKIRILPEPPATEAQLAYAKDLDIKIPKNPTKAQLSILINRAVEEDWPTLKQKQKAQKLGIKIPARITEDELDDLISEREDDIEEQKEESRQLRGNRRTRVRSSKKRGKSSKGGMLLGVVGVIVGIYLIYKGQSGWGWGLIIGGVVIYLASKS